eukprot:CAMPEP_0170523966 /NCGR_PEP_ID=MMETSP0209-20121228/9427_1 /TAXON_ID=665100 ORGANISM="Litonotus pictus, Strain P1" /NCGR_SAMPLE_ID=MMETSP0209 /ASSEMBLY_ACC=CAM_ASM_000301 /LENGTH=714 /DNA_ID=CAMNT_0010812411 /DNA_START=79 /DNA_END=2223 /DNA_ORIENTATION=-
MPKMEGKGMINNQKESWTFKFDKILHNVSQDDLFDYCAKEIIQKSIEGFNGTIFAYGQTGSGKTFTMSGTPNNYSYRGIVPRSITRVFQEIGNKPELDVQVKISYLEIYNETFFDLLSVVPSHQQKGEISIQEDAKGLLIMKGLSLISVSNEEEAFNLLFEGEANKTISEHHLNKESSRSHCIFTVHLEMKSRIESSEKVNTAKLNFVDLAGSERVTKTGSTGVTLKEANYINKSLTFLEQVVISLTERTKLKKTKISSSRMFSGEHVPYRQSKLTHILKDSIGGNCRTVMVATIIPEENHLRETLSSLNFARRMMSVENEATVNIQLDIYKQLKNYGKEIKELKQELAMHNTLSNRGRINYEPYSEKERANLQGIAHNFLIGKEEDIEFDSVRMAKELFFQCRNLYQRYYDSSKEQEMGDNKQEQIHTNKQSSIIRESSKTNFDDGQGELELKPSFGIGKANKNARPLNKLEISQNNQAFSDEEEKPPVTKLISNDNLAKVNYEEKQTTTQYNEENIPDKNTAFNIFKAESKIAKDIEMSISNSSGDLAKRKEQAKEYMDICNTLKAKIEDIKIKLNEKKLNKFNLGDEMTNIIDEEECKYINDLKDLKENYKEYLHLFKEAKSDITNIKNNIDLLKVSFVDNFESWFLKKYGIRIEDYELKIQKGKFGVKHEVEGENEVVVDQEEQAYFNAKKKIASINKARKYERAMKANK